MSSSGASTTYLRAVTEALEREGWKVRGDDTGRLFRLTWTSKATGREFFLVLDLRAGFIEDPALWVKAALDAAAWDMVPWSGGTHRDQQSYVAHDLREFRNGPQARLPKVVRTAVASVVPASIDTRFVADWYRLNYPEDELGEGIDPALTFDAATDALALGPGFYDVLGVTDSFVRERVFEQISRRERCSYGKVYEAWLTCTPLGYDELVAWYRETGARLADLGREWPACWGGQYRLGDSGLYVSEADARTVLRSKYDLDLYICMAVAEADTGEDGLVEVGAHMRDKAWLSRKAELDPCDDGFCYVEPENPLSEFSRPELVELRSSRPDLFSEDDMRRYPELALASYEAGERVRIGGEPTWCSRVAGLCGVRTESELESYFCEEPALADDRAGGASCADWIHQMQRTKDLVPLFGYKLGTRVADSMDGLAEDTVVGVPWKDEVDDVWRQPVEDQEGYRYDPVVDDLYSAPAEPKRAREEDCR